MGISSVSPSSVNSLYSQQQQQVGDASSTQSIDALLGSLEQLVQGQGQGQNPLAQALDAVKKALESGQLGPQDALAQLQQLLQQVLGGTQDPSQVGGVPGSGAPAQTGFSPQDAFQQSAAQGAGQPQAAHGHHHHHGHAKAIAAAADALGMSPDDLRAQLKSGKSIADVANDRGVDVKGIETAIKSELQTRLPDASDDQLQAIADRIATRPPEQPQQPAGLDPNAQTLSAASLNPFIKP